MQSFAGENSFILPPTLIKILFCQILQSVYMTVKFCLMASEKRLNFQGLKAIGGSGVKKLCLVIFEDLNTHESLLFTECQNLIPFKSYCNFNFGNLVGSLINLRTKMKF